MPIPLSARRNVYYARRQLRRFRRGSTLAVVFTGLFLVTMTPFISEDGRGVAQQEGAAEAAEAVETAARPLMDLLTAFRGMVPSLIVALALVVVAAVLARVARPVLRRLLGTWTRADATTALVVIGIWVFAIGAALSVIAGDARALIGSVGLFGLALSWALQTPIESFTGWLLNSFRTYYVVGDRIAVGDVFGDVYSIDILTTTVWEAGGEGKNVTGEQPTGALITFPNSEVLRANITNYTRDFPYVWDELTLGVTNESDLAHVESVFLDAARQVIGERMHEHASAYQNLLKAKNLDFDIAVEPQMFVAPAEAWTQVSIRYLIPARERRMWSSRLLCELTARLALPENRDRIAIAYPRTQVELLKRQGDSAPESP